MNLGIRHAKGEKKDHENSNNVQSSIRNRLLVHQKNLNLPCPNKCSSCNKLRNTRNCQIIISIGNYLCDRLLHCSHFSLFGLMVSLNKGVSIDYQKITAPFRPHVKAPPSYYSALHDGIAPWNCHARNLRNYQIDQNWKYIGTQLNKNNKISSYIFIRQNKVSESVTRPMYHPKQRVYWGAILLGSSEVIRLQDGRLWDGGV